MKLVDKLVIATTNPAKVREIRRLLAGTGIEVLTLDDIEPLRLPPEDKATFRENAEAKARFVAVRSGLAALADDSGLEVDFLGGAPGVYSARHSGEKATDEERWQKFLSGLQGGPARRPA